MNIKRAVVTAAVLLVLSIGAILYIFHDTTVEKLDAVAVNDITQTLAEQWDRLQDSSAAPLPCRQYSLDYVVLDKNGKVLGATRGGLDQTVNAAIENRDTIVDVASDGLVLGKCIIYNDASGLWNRYRDTLLAISIGVVSFIALFCILYAVFIDRTVFRPFRKLRAFARHVAEGKLDVPLEMDRNNLFGAFTESFDLMREELAKARESERLANQSKKELVASLSHDIKTPIASIKAVTEIMILKTDDANDRKQLEVINSKADQVNTLITNMFTATLEELQELSVAVGEHSSQMLYGLIRNADYNSRATAAAIPECMIEVDPLRISQVIDNIVSNSYKYAGTPIRVSSGIRGQYLEMEFRDYGPGVSPDEAPLLFNKFYRARNAAGKSGSGLGLYISKYLMDKMAGEIGCRNTEDGFAVILKLHLA